MSSTSPTTPAAIARAALRRLAEEGLEPTPEHYRRAYAAAAPAGSSPSGAVQALIRRLDRSVLALPELVPEVQAALARDDWQQAVELLCGRFEAPVDATAAHGLGAVLARFVREWDRSQAGLSRVQKLQALQAIESATQPLQALQLLRATTERWSALRERAPAPPPAAASPAQAPARQAGVWKRLWIDAVRMAEQAYASQPEIQAQARALLADAADLDAAGASFAVHAQALWDACERWHAGNARANAGVLDTMRLLLDNVAELFEPEHWIQGQIAAVQEVLRAPMQLQRLEHTVQALKDLLVHQGVLRKAGDDARALARELIDMVVQSLGNYVESSERYSERLRSGMRELDESDDWQQAKSVVQGILAQSQQMLEDTQHLRVSFADAQQQLQTARDRTRALEDELEHLSELIQQDPLTGALNRRGLDALFQREAARAQRNGDVLSLAMVDLDLFKSINDTYGHDTGDAVLRELVQVLRSELRPTDQVARMGGEEFLVLFPGQDEQGAAQALLRAQEVFHARRFAHPRKREGIRAAFSAGVARWDDQERLGEVCARADQALLRAKQAGRSRIEMALPPEPHD